jgi:hypothetical protein
MTFLERESALWQSPAEQVSHRSRIADEALGSTYDIEVPACESSGSYYTIYDLQWTSALISIFGDH